MRRLGPASVLLLGLCACGWSAGQASADDEKGFVSIFDGKTLEGWDGNPKFWRIEDGTITGQTTPENPTQGNTFIIWRGGEPGDFELKMEYKIIGGNSGIQYRSFEVENQRWLVGGYQADFEAGDTWSGANYGERFRGILAKRGEKTVIGDDGKPKVVGKVGDTAELQKKIKKEDWNDYHIIAKDYHFVHIINGHVMSETTDEDKKNRRDKGIIALQLHAGPPMKVQFRNIRIKKLDGKQPEAAQAPQGAGKGGKKKVVFVAGRPSHGYGSHEHNAGSLLLAKELQRGMPNFEAVVHRSGWPQDENAFDGADAVVMYCDGGGGHMVNPHLEAFDKLMKQGVGLVCIHYAVEVPKGKSGDYFLDWLGGYFETHWSVNPHWTAEYKQFPDHPIARGVKPFSIHDEWYYHMRFRENMEGVTPILTALPPDSTLSRGDGAHSGNPHVRAAIADKQPQHMAWAAERPDGGRGFGFTGGHVHWNWGDDNFRKVVLNAIVWVAKGEVPSEGVSSRTPTREDLEANQDFPKPGEKKTGATGERKTGATGEKKTGATGGLPARASAAQPPKLRIQPAALQQQVKDSRDPAHAVEQLDVAEGLEATLIASEPQITSLANLDIDHLGRVWVVDIVNYRHNNGKRPEGDRILVLEDSNGDGTLDKQTVYYQGRDIDTALGICVLGNQVIVSVAPNVFVFTDENGDGKADKKEVLFTKVGAPQHDHSTHSFVFGPDGKYYWNVGNTGQHVHDKDGNLVVDMSGNKVVDNGKPYFGGMPFRCNADGSEFEVLGHNFRNNYEVTVDSFGTLWQSDNDDDGNRGCRINYVMEFGNYGYRDELTGAGWNTPRTGAHPDIAHRHWHQNDPGVVPNLLHTGAGSPTGITVYEGRLLPKVFWDQVIHCDAGPNVVRAYPVVKDGAGYKAEIVDILTGTRDKWFRPADVAVAPDGSLFVTDWYDPGVGGHRQADIERGRLFRIAPPGHKYQAPKFDFTTPEGAVEALKNCNYDARYMAWTALNAMGKEAEPALLKLYEDENPRLRARALWLLGKVEGRGAHYVNLALKDKDEDIRVVGLRLARQLKLDLVPLVRSLVDDPSPQVRRDCAIALRHHESPEAPALWAALAQKHDGQDRWYLEALGIAADRQWEACFGAWLDRVGSNWNTPAGRDIVWRSRTAKTPGLLLAILSDPSVPAEELPRYLRAFDFQSGGEKDEALIELAFAAKSDNAERQKLISEEALKRLKGIDISQHPQYAEALDRVLKASAGKPQFVQLVDKFNVKPLYGELLVLAQQHPGEQLGVDAVRVLLAKNELDLIGAALKSDSAEQVANVVEVLGNSAENRAADLLTPMVQDESLDIALRRSVTRSMAKIYNGAVRLVKMAQNKELDERLKVAAALPLNTAPWQNVRHFAAEEFPLPLAKDDKPLPPLPQLLAMKGDVARGKKVFAEHGTCAKCHVVGDEGKEVGPNLSEIGGKLTRHAMFESILYPSAGISHNYETWSIATTDGNVVTGILTSQTDEAVTIKSADALVRTFPRSEIEEMKKQDISLMPADLQKVLTAEDLADVVEYMSTLKKAGN